MSSERQESPLSLATIEVRAANHQPRVISAELATKRAAVAVVVQERAHGCELLLMKRTVHHGDRWSGQVSFPGGREEQIDPNLRETAVRETLEEVGVDLSASAHFIGPLDAIQARSRAGLSGMSVTPFLFRATTTLEPQPSAEAETTFWLPLTQLLRGDLDDIYPYRIGDTVHELPCWRFEEHVVWGMTHRMVVDFIKVATNAVSPDTPA